MRFFVFCRTCSSAASTDIDAEEELAAVAEGVRLAGDELMRLARHRGAPRKRRRLHHGRSAVEETPRSIAARLDLARSRGMRSSGGRADRGRGELEMKLGGHGDGDGAMASSIRTRPGLVLGHFSLDIWPLLG